MADSPTLRDQTGPLQFWERPQYPSLVSQRAFNSDKMVRQLLEAIAR
jgi:hypothetical protein